jgi:hypothetical protein
MSFSTIAQAAADETLGQRVRAGYAAEGEPNPDQGWLSNRWAIAADPSVAQAYASAVAANNPNPGGDESVVTDAMITATVQAYPVPGP